MTVYFLSEQESVWRVRESNKNSSLATCLAQGTTSSAIEGKEMSLRRVPSSVGASVEGLSGLYEVWILPLRMGALQNLSAHHHLLLLLPLNFQ